jgi:hypothetical protein
MKVKKIFQIIFVPFFPPPQSFYYSRLENENEPESGGEKNEG